MAAKKPIVIGQDRILEQVQDGDTLFIPPGSSGAAAIEVVAG